MNHDQHLHDNRAHGLEIPKFKASNDERRHVPQYQISNIDVSCAVIAETRYWIPVTKMLLVSCHTHTTPYSKFTTLRLPRVHDIRRGQDHAEASRRVVDTVRLYPRDVTGLRHTKLGNTWVGTSYAFDRSLKRSQLEYYFSAYFYMFDEAEVNFKWQSISVGKGYRVHNVEFYQLRMESAKDVSTDAEVTLGWMHEEDAARLFELEADWEAWKEWYHSFDVDEWAPRASERVLARRFPRHP